tara:strand:+ start:424 stop:1026 length:603 start_codon:yes stop_codon:yes gene_type:complete
MSNNCFIKLNTLSQTQMKMITDMALSTFTKRNIVEGIKKPEYFDDPLPNAFSEYTEEPWCNVFEPETPLYNSNIKQYTSLHWHKDIKFISDLILPESLKEHVLAEYINSTIPNTEIRAHIDIQREAMIYLPIYPVKENYMPMMFYYDNQEICLDNYDIGQVYLCNLKICHRVCNSTDLTRFNFQITLNKPYEEICKLIAS